MNAFQEKILQHFNLTFDDLQIFAKPAHALALAQLKDYKHYQAFLTKLDGHIKQQSPILVYGDFDADGMMSSAILSHTLSFLNAHYQTYLPNRYRDGYGLQLTQAKWIVDQGKKLVITIDNGMSSQEAISYLIHHGVDVLVMDHHTVELIPDGIIFLHPELDHLHPLPRCASSIALSLDMHIRGSLHPKLLVMAMIATITDAMPLTDDNRQLVKLGLQQLETMMPSFLQALNVGTKVDEKTIGMTIGPIFNAVGRLIEDEQLQDVITFLLSEDQTILNQLASWLISVNTKRKERSQAIVGSLSHQPAGPIIAIIDEVSGLTGLLASRLVDDQHPIVGIFVKDHFDDQHLVGSLRAMPGIPLLSWVQSHQSIIHRFGGHPQAVGLTIHQKHFETFKSLLLQANIPQPMMEHGIEITTRDITPENYDWLQQLAPFGVGWELPVLILKHVPVVKLTFTSKAPYYLSTKLTPSASIFSFHLQKMMFKDYEEVHFLGTFRENWYENKRKIQYLVDKMTTLQTLQ